MSKFQFKGRDNRGELTTGFIEANSSDAVATQLINSGVIPVEITIFIEPIDQIEALKTFLGIGKPTLDDIILFSRQMYTLMRSGVPIIRAMAGLAESTQNAKMRQIISQLQQDLESGKELATSLASHNNIFSSLYVSIIKVGESSGALDDAFLQIGKYLELEKDTRNRIKTATRYPLFVIIAIVIAMFIINMVVIPQFAQFFKSFGAELPWPTKILMATSEFTVAYWPIILLAIVGAVFAFRSYINTEAGRFQWDRMKLRLPIFGSIIRRAILGRFSRSFAMALKSGVPLIQAMTVVSRAVDNEFVAERVLSMRNAVERGESLTNTAAATGLFTPLVIQMFSVGEETGLVDQLLGEVADFYEREVKYDLDKLSDSIQPILIVIIGVMVLILALGVFLPMWELAGKMKG